jgi:L-glyceraldehyde 3-phosphate reductase
MALSWVLRDDRITSALIGASSVSQVMENIKAAKQTEFTADELIKLDRILAKANLPKSLWSSE